MFRKLHTRISPASLLAAVALFAALGGVSYAAATIGSPQIKDNSIRSKDVRNGNLRGKDLRNDTVTGGKVKESTLGQVPSAAQAESAANADLAANAAIAHSIVDNTVSSSKVQNGSLTGADVGRRAGNVSVGINAVNAGTCKEVAFDADPSNADMRDDAIVMTADQGWPTGLVYSTENSNSVGFIRVNVCNVTGANIDAGNQLFHWVAFDS